MEELQTTTKKYYKIGEVSKLLDVPASTLRYWEKEFAQIKPMKSKKGDRIYSLKDIDILKEIKYLTHDKGIKIAKASQKVRKNASGENPNTELLNKLRALRDQLLVFKQALGE